VALISQYEPAATEELCVIGIVATVTPPIMIRMLTESDPDADPQVPDANTLMVFPVAQNVDDKVVDPVTVTIRVVAVAVLATVTSVVVENIPKAARSEDLVRLPDESDTITPDEDPVAKSEFLAVVKTLVAPVPLYKTRFGTEDTF
jgi:hypothetical protein